MCICKNFLSLSLVLLSVTFVNGVFAQNAMTRAEQARADQTHEHRQAREEWFLRGRQAAGPPAAALRDRAYQQKLRMQAARRAAALATSVSPRLSSTAGWTPLGPAPLASDASGAGEQDYNWVSGRATAVAIDHADSTGNTVYVGGAYGGLWKSTNAGPLCPNPATVTWNAPTSQPGCIGTTYKPQFSLIDGQATLAVGAIAIQPQLTSPDATKSVILVGTGEANSSTDSYYGLGILRSADAGNTWTLIRQDTLVPPHSFAGIGFSKIAFSTSSPSLVVAAAAGTSQGELDGLQSPVTTNLGLYSSADGGLSWSLAVSKDGPSTVEAGSATSVVYNPAAVFNGVAGVFFAALRFHGFYESTDGVNWTRLLNQPGNALSESSCPASPTLQACPFYRGEMAVVPGRTEMYVWFVDANDNDQGIWQTLDGGIHWSAVDETGLTNCGDLIGGCGTENGNYNLSLAAIPDGAATDLYAGAVNLYKCTLLGLSPAAQTLPCDGTGNTFLNLTHVFGCPPDLGSIAKVHPAQHAIDFWPINGGKQVVMYFANDGGIYRALDGYTGLASGSCGTANLFDSLNQTLGSMAQFVSLAQHPTDANTILGGTQGNGSPATGAAQVSTTWSNVNSGDGGYSEIAVHPDGSTEWFTANTGVAIQRCTLGIACHAADFNSDLVVSNSTLGGDGGSLYVPYMLDLQNSGEMLVGTCRLWRGTTAGAGFFALSNNFETNSPAGCTGAEVNMVRSLAIGGAKDSSGFSNTIYAGTDGSGSLAATPAGGHVWVTTNAAVGAASWTDRTGTINPGHFPVSGIALDAADAAGNTAYATIMGFHVSHVWKTTDAGATWTDFTGAAAGQLPDVPANAVLVDPGSGTTPGTVYVATDTGVFSSSTASANWTEVGPAPGSGQAGFLPNVSVSALRMFNTGTTKLLRASTYGRGVWQFPLTTTPDFQMAFPSPVQTIFAGRTATFAGIISAFNNYASQVMLSCSGQMVPKPCSFDQSSIVPTAPGVAFTLTAGGAVGDYSFHAHGADAGGLAHDTPLTLHVVDFTLGAFSPATVSVALGQNSSPVTMQIGFLGSFPANGGVALSCSLPAGVSCSFFPSSSISRSLGSSVTVTLTIAASSNAQPGNFSVSITASSSDAATKTVSQPLGVTVTSSQDYALALSTVPSGIMAAQTAILQGTVTGINGYNSKVQLSCVAGSTPPPPTCTVSPLAVAASGAFALTVGSTIPGNYSFNLQGTGTDVASITHTIPVVLNVFDFTITPNPNAQTVKAGQAATYTLTVTPAGLSVFPQPVMFAPCSPLPSFSSCSFNPSQISSGSGNGAVTLTVSTTASVASRRSPVGRSHETWFCAALLPMTLMLSCATPRRRRHLVYGVATGVLLLLTALQPACGGGLTGGSSVSPPPQAGTSPGTYLVIVNASEGSGGQQLQHSVTVTLTVQ
jgi:hypothetical protein